MDLLKLAEQSARAAVSAGGDQQALLNAQIARAQGHERLHELESTLESRRAGLNAMLHRPVKAALPPPTRLPSATPIHLNDAQVLALAALRDPKLKVLVHTVVGRSKAIDLAKLQSLPDLNPEFAFTGSISRMIGAGLSIPQVRLPAIRAMVREAHDQWRAAIGQLEQAQYDQAAQVVTALVMIRHHQHNERLFSRRVLPAARRIIASLQQEYVAGSIPQAKLIEAQRTVLAVQRTIAEARIGREKWLASLEAIMGKLPEKTESQQNKR
jgi:outer membrane protein TolC